MKVNSGYNFNSSIGSTHARTPVPLRKFSSNYDPYASFVESHTNTMDAYMTPIPISNKKTEKISLNGSTIVSKQSRHINRGGSRLETMNDHGRNMPLMDEMKRNRSVGNHLNNIVSSKLPEIMNTQSNISNSRRTLGNDSYLQHFSKN